LFGERAVAIREEVLLKTLLLVLLRPLLSAADAATVVAAIAC